MGFAPPRGIAALCTGHCSTCVALDIGISGPDTKVHFDTDIGLEMRFTESWLLRFGLTLGSNNALGFGIVF